MHLLLAILSGALFAAGVWLILRRSLARLLLGLILLSNAANLIILTAGGLQPDAPAIIGDDAQVLDAAAADPLPQALVLTSIVIGLGVLALMVSMVIRLYEKHGTFDMSQISKLRG